MTDAQDPGGGEAGAIDRAASTGYWQVRTEHNWAFPLNAAGDFDCQASLHAGLSTLQRNEEVEISYLFCPVDRTAGRKIARIGRELRRGIIPPPMGRGRSIITGLARALRELVGLLLITDTSGAKKTADERARIVEQRSLEPLLATAILIAITADGEDRQEVIAREVDIALAHLASPFNRLRLSRLRASEPVRSGYANWVLPAKGRFVATVAEAAALCELPTSQARAPNLTRAPAARVPAASLVPRGRGLFLGLPEAGDHSDEDYYGLQIDDAMKHLLTVGPTGTGKSTFQFWYAISAIRAGLGLLLLDPKGDLAENLLAAVPASRADDVAYLDFADTGRPIGLNPLRVNDPAEADQTAAAVSTMMRELITGEGMAWGTTMSQAFAYGFRTLAANPQVRPTMLDLERLFFDADWRAGLLERVDDPFVQAYWANQIDRLGERQFELNFGSALRRMAMLVNDPRIRNILAQPRPAVRWDRALVRSGIVLVNLNQADNALGIAGSRLLGSIIVTQFWQAVLRRQPDRRPAFVFAIDEFQEFLDTGRNMGAFFERARSYRVGMCIATQTLAQPRLKAVRRTVLINARTHVIFGGLRDEARHFAIATEPFFSARDLDRRDAFEMTVSTLVSNRPAPPFSAHVAPVPVPDPKLLAQRRKRARDLFGADRAALDDYVRERYGRR